MADKFSFMVPITRPGATDRTALASAMMEAGYGPLDAYERNPWIELDPNVPWIKDRGWLIFDWGWDEFVPIPEWAVARADRQARLSIELITPEVKECIAVMDCLCLVGGPNPGFDIVLPDYSHGTISGVKDETSEVIFHFKTMRVGTRISLGSRDLRHWDFVSLKVFQHV